MHTETMMFVGWITVPMVAYTAGLFAIRVDHSRLAQREIAPDGRLAVLRRRQASGERVVRGRMAEALLLAESASSGSTTSTQRS